MLLTLEKLEKKSPNHRKHLILTHFLNLGLQPNNFNDVQPCFDSLGIDIWLFMLQNQLVPSKLLLQHVTRQVLVNYPLYIQYLSLDLILLEIIKVNVSALTWVHLHKSFHLEITEIYGDLSPLLSYLSSTPNVVLSEQAQKAICQFYSDLNSAIPYNIFVHLSVLSKYPLLYKQSLLSFHAEKSQPVDQLSLYPSPLVFASNVTDLQSMLQHCSALHVYNGKSILECRSWQSDELECLFNIGKLPTPDDPFYSKSLIQNVMELNVSAAYSSTSANRDANGGSNRNSANHSTIFNASNASNTSNTSSLVNTINAVSTGIYEYYYLLSRYDIDLRPLLKDKNIVNHELLCIQLLLFVDKLDISTLNATEQYTLANMRVYYADVFIRVLRKLTIKTTMCIVNNIPLIPLSDGEIDTVVLRNVELALLNSQNEKNEYNMKLTDLEFGTTPLHSLLKRYASYHVEHNGERSKLHALLKMKSKSVIKEYPATIKQIVQMMVDYIYMLNKMSIRYNIADKSGHYPLCLIKDLDLPGDLKEFIKDKQCMNCCNVKQDLSDNCPICRDAMSSKHSLPCGHEFCKDCITEWLRSQHCCPYCRRRATVEDLKEHVDEEL
eukprot:NODE_18_length_40692_cov_0.469183.p6 type:complete len:608 gc:universal NODE_18_length_40692_cov_0.469183:37838-36015(-)